MAAEDNNNIDIAKLKKEIIEDLGKSKGYSLGYKTINDLAALIREEDYDTAINVIADTALDVKFTVKSRAKRRRKLQELRGYLANTQAHARAGRQDAAYRQGLGRIINAFSAGWYYWQRLMMKN